MKPRKRDNAAALAGEAASDDSGQRASDQHTPAAACCLSVITVKSNGNRVLFGLYRDRIEAERVIVQLRKLGCAANIEQSRADDVAGRQRGAR